MRDPDSLDGASRDRTPDWDVCRSVVRIHGRTFFFASHFLTPRQRNAVFAVYAYCRIADDIVDRAPKAGLHAAAASLARWEAEIDDPTHPVAVAFAAVRSRYHIPADPARDLIAGVRMDLQPDRYSTWADLELYCYRVAGTVGLMVAPIFGCRDHAALDHAVELGIAMQLTNILRDVGEDAVAGRLYLPLEDLARFGCDPAAVMAGRPSGRFDELMQFEIARARALYASGQRGIPALSPPGQLTTLVASTLYSGILRRIEEEDFNVFSRRAYVPYHRKLRELPGIAAAFASLYLPGSVASRSSRS
ncbi:MAG: phytoene/squalene synthase family protein [Thermomicrobiales bacterium]